MRRNSNSEDQGPEQRREDAALVCGSCGQLGWPTQQRNPLRHAADDSRPTLPPCSHCNDESWIDLGQDSTALALLDHEDNSKPFFSLGFRLLSAITSGSILGAFFSFMVGGNLPFVLIAFLCGGVLASMFVLRNHQRAQGHSMHASLPARWTMALPPASDKGNAKRFRGTAQPSGELLRAPLSGRPCVAWEVGVRLDDEATAEPRSWQLLEQRLAPLSVDGHAIDPTRTHLTAPRQRLDRSADVKLDEAAQAFLRQRGFDGGSTAARLFETIVGADDAVTLLVYAEGRSTLRVDDNDAREAIVERLALHEASEPDEV